MCDRQVEELPRPHKNGGELNACRAGAGVAETSEASRKGAQRASESSLDAGGEMATDPHQGVGIISRHASIQTFAASGS